MGFGLETTWISSRHPELFCEKGVLKNFAKLIEKHLCQSLFKQSCVPEACNLFKRETLTLIK